MKSTKQNTTGEQKVQRTNQVQKGQTKYKKDKLSTKRTKQVQKGQNRYKKDKQVQQTGIKETNRIQTRLQKQMIQAQRTYLPYYHIEIADGRVDVYKPHDVAYPSSC